MVLLHLRNTLNIPISLIFASLEANKKISNNTMPFLYCFWSVFQLEVSHISSEELSIGKKNSDSLFRKSTFPSQCRNSLENTYDKRRITGSIIYLYLLAHQVWIGNQESIFRGSSASILMKSNHQYT